MIMIPHNLKINDFTNEQDYYKICAKARKELVLSRNRKFEKVESENCDKTN